MGLAAVADDYLFLAPLIKARLVEQVPDVPVEIIETPDQVLAADHRQQVLMVLWAGDLFTDDAGRGSSQLARQRWLVILGLNNAGAMADARQRVAGPLLSRVHRALAGWAPAGAGTRAFSRVSSPLAPALTNTKATYPLGFQITLTL